MMTNKELQEYLKCYPDDDPVVLFVDSMFDGKDVQGCYRTVNTVHSVSLVTNDGENFNSSPQGKTKVIYLGSL